MARFNIELTAQIDVDETVLTEALSEEWRSTFYDLRTREQVAAHLFYNLIRGVEITELDGFADMLRASAKIVRDSIDVCGDEVADVNGAPKPSKTKPAKRRNAR